MQTAEATKTATETFVLVEVRGNVGLITLNRPKVFNALCDALTDQLTAALDAARGRRRHRSAGADRQRKGIRGRGRHQGDEEPLVR